jgi:hypothetical protein
MPNPIPDPPPEGPPNPSPPPPELTEEQKAKLARIISFNQKVIELAIARDACLKLIDVKVQELRDGLNKDKEYENLESSLEECKKLYEGLDAPMKAEFDKITEK